jgi:UDP-N-acetylmuramyl pentapeptide phosphotransferase/UDP-N-acetylglucosamine-1-phosphate transferase
VEPDPFYGPFDNYYVSAIAFVSLTIVPVMIAWWVVAQLVDRRRRKSGIRTGGGRWQFLRYGPTAPLIPAAVFLFGISIWILHPDKEVISPSVRFCLLIMAGAGLIAFVISWMLWQLSNPPRSKSDPT